MNLSFTPFSIAIAIAIVLDACDAFVVPFPLLRTHHRSAQSLTLEESKSGELWKVEQVEHISDWTGSTKTYPSPLSLPLLP